MRRTAAPESLRPPRRRPRLGGRPHRDREPIASAIGGDTARSLEVLGESLLATEGTTEILKAATGRRRPHQGNRTSFPSSHTSFAFMAATFVARSTEDITDACPRYLGNLAYLPAAYVGINRVEGGRHFPSDVTFGAFLGVFFTNWIYDAHYGDADHLGIFGRSGWHLEPAVSADGVALGLAIRF